MIKLYQFIKGTLFIFCASALGATIPFTALSAEEISPEKAQLIVWNVGQGQWATWQHDDVCEHFDIGGEFAPWKLISEHCRTRRNRAHFSHWDWDHIGLAEKASRRLNNFCVVDFPRGPAPNKGKERILNLPACNDLAPTREDLRAPTRPHQLFWRDPAPIDKLSSNDLSRVFNAGSALIPGDSTQREEKFWSSSASIYKPKILVLGHHGSRTSTSEELVRKLTSLSTAISSARFVRYGHPHQEVVTRLREHHIALLKTEDWGSIRMEVTLPEKEKAPEKKGLKK